MPLTSNITAINDDEEEETNPFNSLPSYISTSVDVASRRVIESNMGHQAYDSSSYPIIEITLSETGILNGVGNVTNMGTWVDNYRREGITFNTGIGVFSTPDGLSTAPWKAYDMGTTNETGDRTFKGLLIFENNANGELSFLANTEWLYIIKLSDPQPTVRMWEW